MKDINKAPIPSPNPAGIKTDKSKVASDFTYNSYNPNEDNITALSTPGTIEEPATATPKRTDWNKFGFVICGNKFLLKLNKQSPNIADVIITA